MQLGTVIGHATSTVKHPSLVGWRMVIVQLLGVNRQPEADPVVAVDKLGSAARQRRDPQQRRQSRSRIGRQRQKPRSLVCDWNCGRMIVTARQLQDLHKTDGHVRLPIGTRLTPMASDWLRSKRITIVYGDAATIRRTRRSLRRMRSTARLRFAVRRFPLVVRWALRSSESCARFTIQGNQFPANAGGHRAKARRRRGQTPGK